MFDLWQCKTGSDAERARHVLRIMTEPLPDIENVNTDNLQNRISYICKKLADYWKKCNRTQSRFMEKHSAWLDVVEACNLSRIRSSQHMQDVSEEEAHPSTSTAGRPLKETVTA